MTTFLAHTTLPADVREKADSIGARSVRIRRWLSQASATGPTVRSAKDELAALIREAKALWEVI
ncbi:hypothetical protein LRS10_13585 [Phenylobacterium sp. J426]|uniref:hypothetical protein n=1 Tax=Phenylobacterium sp. J426 TaxID=2898439 RepID=UPI0021517DEB|nr:hypothetical protein [Phenylobacterium sp. J426]MCR5875125.1 hypothetical protein [Phenylobacterium sp. J426]